MAGCSAGACTPGHGLSWWAPLTELGRILAALTFAISVVRQSQADAGRARTVLAKTRPVPACVAQKWIPALRAQRCPSRVPRHVRTWFARRLCNPFAVGSNWQYVDASWPRLAGRSRRLRRTGSFSATVTPTCLPISLRKAATRGWEVSATCHARLRKKTCVARSPAMVWAHS
jgi:hypothetical protein